MPAPGEPNHRHTVAGSLAGAANVIAGAIVTMMILVQLALRYPQLDAIAASGKDEALQTIVHWVWYVVLGLDVSFDVFIGLGTFCFALRMLTHPRFGKVFGILGMALSAVLLLGLNFYTFPYPPRAVGLPALDPGPHTAAWYLAVTIQMWRSVGWFRGTQGGRADRPAAESPALRGGADRTAFANADA